MDDILEFFLEVLYETVGARIATAIMTVLTFIGGILTTMWYSHLHKLVNICTEIGTVGQVLIPNAPDCTIDRPLRWVVLVVMVLAWLAFAGFTAGMVYLVANPTKFRKEAKA